MTAIQSISTATQVRLKPNFFLPFTGANWPQTLSSALADCAGALPLALPLFLLLELVSSVVLELAVLLVLGAAVSLVLLGAALSLAALGMALLLVVGFSFLGLAVVLLAVVALSLLFPGFLVGDSSLAKLSDKSEDKEEDELPKGLARLSLKGLLFFVRVDFCMG